MRINIFTDEALLWLGPFPLTPTMITSTVVSVLLVAAGWLVARAVVKRPDGRAAAAGRSAVRFIQDLVQVTAGRRSEAVQVFAGTLMLFIAGSALLGQLPSVHPPTATLGATAALAALVFLAVPVAGIRARGLRLYLSHYLKPNPVLFPLHMITELSRTVALALRLFGNMLSGQIVVAVIVSLVGLIVPIPLMALDLLIGFLQAYIFTILACAYIGAGIQVGEQGRT